MVSNSWNYLQRSPGVTCSSYNTEFPIIPRI